jgi:hypothetical protein
MSDVIAYAVTAVLIGLTYAIVWYRTRRESRKRPGEDE